MPEEWPEDSAFWKLQRGPFGRQFSVRGARCYRPSRNRTGSSAFREQGWDISVLIGVDMRRYSRIEDAARSIDKHRHLPPQDGKVWT